MAGTNLAVIVRSTPGAVLLPDNKGWINRIQIPGSTGNAYVVAMRQSNQTWGCSCRGWVRWQQCKHLTIMFPALQIAFPNSKLSTPLVKG